MAWPNIVKVFWRGFGQTVILLVKKIQVQVENVWFRDSRGGKIVHQVSSLGLNRSEGCP